MLSSLVTTLSFIVNEEGVFVLTENDINLLSKPTSKLLLTKGLVNSVVDFGVKNLDGNIGSELKAIIELLRLTDLSSMEVIEDKLILDFKGSRYVADDTFVALVGDRLEFLKGKKFDLRYICERID